MTATDRDAYQRLTGYLLNRPVQNRGKNGGINRGGGIAYKNNAVIMEAAAN
jgi:hypothetical protein